MIISNILSFRKREVQVEYISLAASMGMATLIVQMAILKLDLSIVAICFVKNLFATFFNIVLIMYSNRIRIVVRSYFLGVLVYVIGSIPYVEISIISFYQGNLTLGLHLLQYYAVVYLCMGLFIKQYLNLSKKLINRILDGDLFWESPFFYLKNICSCLVIGNHYIRCNIRYQ